MTDTAAGEFRWLLARVRPYRAALTALLTLFLLGAALGLVYPLILRHLIDDVFVGGTKGGLLPALALLLGLSLAQIVVTQISNYRYTRIAGRVVLDLRLLMFRHLERLPLRFYAEHRAGDVASRIGGDIAEVQNAATGTVLTLATSVATLLATMGVLVYLDPVLFGLSLVFFPFAILISRRFAPSIRTRARVIREENANLGSTLFDSILGQHFIRSHGLESRAARRFFHDGRGVFRAVLDLTRLSCWSSALNGLLSSLGTLFVLGVGGWRVVEGQMSLGTLLAFQLYMGGMYGPIQGLLSLYLRLQRSRVSIRRILDILEIPRETTGGTRGARDISGILTFDEVSFAYEVGRPILEDVSFTVSPGERLAIVGPSGIGKSTLLDLAIGLRVPTGGRILIDGAPIESYRPDSLRHRVGVVSQDVFLFNASIIENLRLVDPTVSEDAIWEALTAAGLADWVHTLPQGLGTPVGERALRLSGGQRQRLALVRAILRRPAILVLDEATSALDEISDAQVRAALEPLHRVASTLVATHRRSFIEEADRALVLADGRVAAEGTPSEVLARLEPRRSPERHPS